MAKKKEDLGGVWRTVGGRRIFIKDGQDLYEAMNDSGKFTNLKRTNKAKQEVKEIDYIGQDGKKHKMDSYEYPKDREGYHKYLTEKYGTYKEEEIKDKNGRTDYKKLREEFYQQQEKNKKLYEVEGLGKVDEDFLKREFEKHHKDDWNSYEEWKKDTLADERSAVKEVVDKEYIKKVASAKNDKELNEADKYYKEKTGKNWDSDKEKHEYELYKRAREDENSIDPMTENSTDWEELDRKYKGRYEKEQSSIKEKRDEKPLMGDINDLRKLTESSLSEEPHDYYNKMKETRDEYLEKYDKYSGSARPEKMTADDVWSPGYKESMYEQFENRIGDYKGDDYQINKIQDTLAIIEKEASGSLHNKYLALGGKYTEEYDRKQYGDAKVDAAIMREQEMLRKGYTNIATSINPRGLVNSFEYSDMIISGEKNGIQVSVNYNKKGESAISLKSRDKHGGYGELMITEDNYKTVRDMISRGSIGSDFRESMPYSAYEIKKLTADESKEYYEKANNYYKENKEKHYYDNKFFDDYNEKLKDEIIARRKKNK